MDRRRRAARTVALMSLFTMADTQIDVPIASFDGDGSDLISLIVGIEPIQAGSGDPSPDNVRPISGWTGANIHVSPTTDAADGTTYSITFPTEAGTVYGGTLDVTSGVLTVDRAMYTFSESDVWTKYEVDGKMTFNSGDRFPVGVDTRKPCIMSNYPFIKTPYISVQPDKSFSLFPSPWLSVCDSGYSDASTFASAMAGNQLVYYLATPIVYDLTPTQVTTLIGTNNIWADTGDIKYIEYNI